MFARYYHKYLVACLMLFIIAGIVPVCFAASTITNPTSCPATLPAGTSGTFYSFTFAGTGGNRWTVWSGFLPAGLNLNRNSGILSGTPTGSGTYTFTVRYRAINGTSATCTCTLTISSNITTPASCPALITTAVRGSAYTYTFRGTGGIGNPWSIISGALPTGLTLNAGTGVVSGTPTAAVGQYNFTIRYNGTGGTYDTCDCTIIVQSAATTCTISGSGALNFGTLNGIDNAGGATAVVTAPTITCTNGSRIYITDNGGMNEATPGVQPARMADMDGSDYIEYTFSYTSPLTGQGAVNIGPNLNLTGHIAAGELDNTPAGPYTDTITLTISY